MTRLSEDLGPVAVRETRSGAVMYCTFPGCPYTRRMAFSSYFHAYRWALDHYHAHYPSVVSGLDRLLDWFWFRLAVAGAFFAFFVSCVVPFVSSLLRGELP